MRPLRATGNAVGYVLAGLLFIAAIGKLLATHAVILEDVLSLESSLLRWLVAAAERAAGPLELLVAFGLLRRDLRFAACALGMMIAVGFLVVALGLPDGASCSCFGVFGGFTSAAAHLAVAMGVLAAFGLVAVAAWPEGAVDGAALQEWRQSAPPAIRPADVSDDR